jgi:hypothetical protein
MIHKGKLRLEITQENIEACTIHAIPGNFRKIIVGVVPENYF